MEYFSNVWNIFSKAINVLIGGSPAESISARSYREQWPLEHLINGIFFWQERHCRGAYNMDIQRAQTYAFLPDRVEGDK